MFEIQSFLLKPTKKVFNLQIMTQDPYAFFVSIDNKELINSYSKQFNYDVLDGAIILRYNNVTILNFIDYDAIDDTWAYILNIMQSVLDNGVGETYFPDHPTLLKMIKKNGNIIFSVGNKEYYLPLLDFFEALCNSAEHFFTKMMDYFHRCHYSYELTEIKKIRERLQKRARAHGHP